jgi:hypothetical protein
VCGGVSSSSVRRHREQRGFAPTAELVDPIGSRHIATQNSDQVDQLASDCRRGR